MTEAAQVEARSSIRCPAVRKDMSSMGCRVLLAALIAAVACGVGVRAAVVSGQSPSSDLPYGPDTCRAGYVWREAFTGDTVCVTPEIRTQTAADNAQADARRDPNGGAYGPDTCLSGYVWRVARPDDLVCVTPETRTQVAADNAQATTRWQAFAPGTHTVALDVGQLLRRRSDKYYTDTCNPGGPSPIFDPTAIEVGWGQVEVDGDPCYAAVGQAAVRFDTGPLDRIPEKTIGGAVLIYDEVPSQGCFASPGPDPSCWRSGGGGVEDKPNGCVVVRVPAVDWATAEPAGLIPYLAQAGGRPTVTQLGPRAWDVTEPYRWQTDPSAMPLQAPGSPPLAKGFGFLLAGGPSLDDLTAEDNTFCMSLLANISVLVTYTVPSDEPFRAPR
jgi:hypothetical protein